VINWIRCNVRHGIKLNADAKMQNTKRWDLMMLGEPKG
jgi:hypothetical protein